MNILFVLYHDFSTSSAIHVHNFANLLAKNGCNCAVAVPANKESVTEYLGGDVLYQPCTFAESLERSVELFSGEAMDIIHAWTPRENVRKQCDLLKKRYPGSKLIVHLEDNEEMIVESFVGLPYDQIRSLSEERLRFLLPDLLASPYHYPLFLEQADAVSVITDALLDFVPSHKVYHRLWPAIDLRRFSPEIDGRAVRNRLGFSEDDFLICYVGSVHGVNAQEVRSLYQAGFMANDLGIPVRLIRAGRDVVDFLGADKDELQRYVTNVGYVDMDDVPGLMAAADLLVQPGENDRFNRYRLPSKIPEFLAVGKPVAVPRVNIGLHLQDRENAFLMETGDAASIVAVIRLISNDRELGERIGANGRTFAELNFSEDTVYGKLSAFYESVLAL
ncbi:glycosyltransferase [Desulfocapsa sulfexigens DSM 10523]|uniref:Glycosyltransferase n=1 Tax=Desulfocapsa sulfexigens (strain DSM 10523 / SB164P1) TaxID=1167006 RepID=M1PRN4_DESSD|nr:glycosyltransferase family 4 protein [Desulfocapsa sulfexigens]AGF78996.1 glycosyltransferase [Desulfocapsa sulfexigens DSM 10523]